MTLRTSGHSLRGSDRCVAAFREPAHVAMLTGGKKVGQSLTNLIAKLGAAETDSVKAERKRPVAHR